MFAVIKIRKKPSAARHATGIVFACLVLFCSASPIFARNTALFSDSIKANALLKKLSAVYVEGRWNEALRLGTMARNHARRSGSELLLGRSFFALGQVYEQSGNLAQAEDNLALAIRHIERTNNKALLCDYQGAYGNLALKRGQTAVALDYLLKSLSYAEQLKDSSRLATCFSNIGILYWSTGRTKVSRGYLEKAVAIRERQKDISGLAYSYGNLAIVNKLEGKDEAAMHNYQKTLEMCKELNDSVCIGNVYNNIGVLLQDQGNPQEALRFHLMALGMRNQQKDLQSLTISFLNIGGLYRKLNRPKKALEFTQKALKIALKTGALEDLRDVYELMALLKEEEHHYGEALGYFRRFQKANDSLMRSREEEKMARTELNYELAKRKQSENLREEKRSHIFQLDLQRGRQQRNLFIMAFVFALIVGMLLFFAIIRSRRATQLLREKNEALQEINRQQVALTQIVAHDLRTPISQIKGLVTIMGFTGELSAEQREVVEKINAAASGGNQLINDLLEIAFIEQDEGILETQDMEVIDLLDSVCSHFLEEARRKQMMVVNRFNGTGTLRTNPVIIQQILNNLVSNAIKFSEFGKMVYLDAEKIDKAWIISVTDQGPGIPEHEMPELFMKFRRLSNRPTGGETSHGLGLYGVKLLANKLGGTVTCASKEGKGSVFSILLNINAPA